MKAKKKFVTTIADLSHDGRGVAHVNGKAVFIPNALPGEEIEAELTRKKRHFDEAIMTRIITPSDDRVTPKCPHFSICGGCSLQHLASDKQIMAKQKVLRDNFTRIGKIEPEAWLPVLTANMWGYRRRGRLSVRYVAKKGRVLVGFREKRNPRYVADLSRCEVIHPHLGEHLDSLARMLESLHAREHIAQIEFAAGDECVALVFRHMRELDAHDLAVLRAFGQNDDFAIYLQPGGVHTVHPLWPEHPHLAFGFDQGQLQLAFEPLDFIQINAWLNEKMLAQALDLLQLETSDRVLDLFCGLGNFTLPLARRAAHVTGVEGDTGLVERARANAIDNGLSHVDFKVADLFLDHSQSAFAQASYDKILLDPPRAGADKVLEYLPGTGVTRVVYVSCHPASLARDASCLVNKHGFHLQAAGVMDMFPHTSHVESIALFTRDR